MHAAEPCLDTRWLPSRAAQLSGGACICCHAALRMPGTAQPGSALNMSLFSARAGVVAHSPREVAAAIAPR